MSAYGYGQRLFGESYVQEVKDKAARLPEDIQWHFIGHLQTNKCKTLLQIENMRRVESVDSIKLCDSLQKACQTLDRTVEVLVQVKTSDEASKTGADPTTVRSIVKHIVCECNRLTFRGLMTIANPEYPTNSFECMCDLEKVIMLQLNEDKVGDVVNEDNVGDVVNEDNVGDAVNGDNVGDVVNEDGVGDVVNEEEGMCCVCLAAKTFAAEHGGELVLSMGMSNDMRIALKHGATQLRIGTAVFGQRKPRK